MAADFVSSFGGDGGPNEAIALWRQEPGQLKRLAKSTGGPCRLLSPNYLECPPQAGVDYRAGFKLVGGRWVFAAFVVGD